MSFPHLCACCGAPPETQYSASYTRVTGKRVIRTQTATWNFPYCNNCIAHVRAWPEPWSGVTWFLVLITCFLWIPVQLLLDAAARGRSRQLCCQSCTQPSAAVAYLGWNGSVESFDIAAPVFAFEFALANSRNVVNMSYEMRAEVERYVAQKQHRVSPHMISRASAAPAPPNPAYVPPMNADEQVLTSALEQLESLKGSAARRNALEAALAKLQAQHLRERLLIEAARIEVRAVFDKVDSLKSPAAKRRHLEAALEQIRNDPVPDQLQAAEIAALERALRDLEAR
jgi:hypothetical protein